MDHDTLDVEVVKTVATVLPIIAFFQLVDGNASVTAGVLRAKGDQVRASEHILMQKTKFVFAVYRGSLES
jgi:Na+-driven multidrug efflux pump